MVVCVGELVCTVESTKISSKLSNQSHRDGRDLWSWYNNVPITVFWNTEQQMVSNRWLKLQTMNTYSQWVDLLLFRWLYKVFVTKARLCFPYNLHALVLVLSLGTGQNGGHLEKSSFSWALSSLAQWFKSFLIMCASGKHAKLWLCSLGQTPVYGLTITPHSQGLHQDLCVCQRYWNPCSYKHISMVLFFSLAFYPSLLYVDFEISYYPLSMFFKLQYLAMSPWLCAYIVFGIIAGLHEEPS